MTTRTLATSYALAVGTACPLAFGLGKVCHAPALPARVASFVVSCVCDALPPRSALKVIREITDSQKPVDFPPAHSTPLVFSFS